MSRPWSDAVQRVLDAVDWADMHLNDDDAIRERFGSCRCPLEVAANTPSGCWADAAGFFELSSPEWAMVLGAADPYPYPDRSEALRAEMLRRITEAQS